MVELDHDDGAVVLPKPGFLIDTQGKAEWAMATLSRAERNIQRRKLVLDEIIRKASERIAEANIAEERTIQRMQELLKPWAEVEIAKSRGAKHVKLIAGQIGYRQNPERLDVTDEKAALAALPDDCKRVKVEVNKVAVKKLIQEKGEVPPGCELVPGDVQWYIKTSDNDMSDEALALLLPDIPE